MNATQALETLDKDYQSRRAELVAIQQAEEARIKSLALTEQSASEAAERDAQRVAEQVALDLDLVGVEQQFEAIREAINGMNEDVLTALALLEGAGKKQPQIIAGIRGALRSLGTVYASHKPLYASPAHLADAAHQTTDRLMADIQIRPPVEDQSYLRGFGFVSRELGLSDARAEVDQSIRTAR